MQVSVHAHVALQHLAMRGQDHYPERLGVMVMFGAPTVFHGLWMAVVPFIAEETRCAHAPAAPAKQGC